MSHEGRPDEGVRTAVGAVFALPVRADQAGPTAAWVTTGGLATAVAERLGASIVMTPDGLLAPSEVLERAGGTRHQQARAAGRGPLAPLRASVLATATKDIRRWRDAARFKNRLARAIDMLPSPPRLVWQRHDLFPVGAADVAEAHGVPLVESVHALQVREARGWGVRRPLWGPVLEKGVECRALKRADLVTCISSEVAQTVVERGLPAGKILVLPNGVDTELFRPREADQRLAATLGLDSVELVVGWSGSFRGFHGLDTLLEAISEVEKSVNVGLLLVGDGLHRLRVSRLAEDLGIVTVALPGTVPYREMPNYLALMDVTVVLSGGSGGFHYSPVKLREYFACGRPVVAHAVGELQRELRHGVDALLVERGDPKALAEAILQLSKEEALSAALSQAGRRRAVEDWSWGRRAADLHAALADLGHCSTRTP